MSKMSALSRKAKGSRGYTVRRPRAMDGVGSALRTAFSDDFGGIPADMRELLWTIERGAPKHTA